LTDDGVNDMRLPPSIVEATRLTRDGRLEDATRLLRDMLTRSASPHRRAEPTPLKHSPAQLPGTAAPAAAQHTTPQPSARFETLTYADARGRMAYKLYVPLSVAANPALIVMLHGCTQTPDDFARGTAMNILAEEFGLIVAYPEQTRAANASRCWNWFRPGDQRRDSGEPALIAGMAREIIARHRIDPQRVYIAGLSAGGAAAAIMGEAYPDLFAAVGVHSGLACGAASDMAGAMMAMRGGGRGRTADPAAPTFVPTIAFHGDRDHTVDRINSDEIIARAQAAFGGTLIEELDRSRAVSGRSFVCRTYRDGARVPRLAQWTINGAGHAWAGGNAAGSYTDPQGPDASREMVRFFLAQAR
jgi:poly(hydroxyalkanoate) depolymerase family esterase